MVYSSLQLEASVAFLILYFLVSDCSSSPLYASGTNSKMTSMNGTINVDYHQSLSHDRNEYISTNKTSHGAEAKPQSYININQNKVTFSMGEETSLMNHVNNNPATDGTRNSRRFSRSEGTGSCNLKTRPNISREIKKWISYVASCSDESSSKCHDSCSVNNTELNKYLKIGIFQWGDWQVTAACPFTISTNESYVTAVCQNTGRTKCQNGNHRNPSRSDYGCHQVYYTDVPHSLCKHPVGCVYATKLSVKAGTRHTPHSVQK